MKRNALLNPHLRRGFILPAVVVVLTFVSFLFFVAHVRAADGIQKTINFQGKVTNTDGTNVADGAYDFVIKIYDGAGNSASALFTETWSNAALFSSTMATAPTTTDDMLVYSSDTNEATLKVGQILWNTTKKESVVITSVNTGTNTLGISRTRQNWANSDTITNRVYVKDGVFRIAINSLNADLSGVNFNSNTLFVGVNFNADGEMKPRMQLRSTPYAFNAEKVNGLTVTNTSNNPFSTATTLKINDGSTITFGGSFTTSGSNALTLSTSGTTSLTLPSGTTTLVAIDSADTLTNKKIGNTGLLFENDESISNGTNGTITFGRNDAGIVTLTAKDDDATAALTILPGGAAGLTLGGASTTALTVITDGTGNAEVVLPDGSIGSQEILDGDLLPADLKITGSASDEFCLTYESTGTQFEWQSCGISSQWTTVNTNDIQYATGNVGIGLTNPGTWLHVSNSGNTATGKALAIFDQYENQDIFTASKSGSTKFVITKDGNVGIGTTSPGAALYIKDSSPLPLYGSEMISAVADRDFSSSTGNWSGTNWSVAGGVATHTSSGSNNFLLSNSALTATAVSGTTYEVSYTATTTTAGTIHAYFGGTNGSNVGQTVGTTYHTDVIEASMADVLAFIPDSSWVGSIDNVSVKVVTPSMPAFVIESSDGAIRPLEIRAGGSGWDNVFIGTNVGKFDAFGDNNVAIGSDAFSSNTSGAFNTAIGTEALLKNSSGYDNVAIGYQALYSNTTGDSNNAFGDYALVVNNTGDNNSAFGESSLEQNISGSNNSAFGQRALKGNTTGSNNLALGFAAGENLTTGSNNIAIGYDIDLPSATGSNQLNIGNLIYGTGLDGTNGTMSSGNIGIGTTAPGAKLDVVGASTSTTAGVGLGSKITFTDSGNVSTGTDWSIGQYINFTRSGASGGTIYGVGQYITATASGTLSSIKGSAIEVSGAQGSIYGQDILVTTNADENTTGYQSGLILNALHLGSSTLYSQYGIDLFLDTQAGNTDATTGINDYVFVSSGTTTTAKALNAKLTAFGGSITNGYGLYVNSPAGDAGAITNAYGVYIGDHSGSYTTNGYNLYSVGESSRNIFQGLVGIGTTNPGTYLQVSNSGNTARGKALAIFDQYENQDIFAASASGAPKFAITKDGGIRLGTSEGSSGNCLKSGGTGAAATWGSCGTGTSQWTDVAGGMYYNSGNVGIGTTNPTRPLYVSGTAAAANNGSVVYMTGNMTSAANNQLGLYSDMNVNVSGAAGNTYTGLQGSLSSSLTNSNLSGASLIGLRGTVYFDGVGGTFGEVKGGDYIVQMAAAGTINNAYGLMINNATNSGGTITNLYGLAVVGQTTGTNVAGLAIGEAIGTSKATNLLIGTTSIPSGSWSIYNSSPDANYFAGNLGIGTTTPGTYLQVSNSGNTAKGKALAIFDQYENQDIFTASASGTTQFVINKAGYIGVGRNDPTYKMDIVESTTNFVPFRSLSTDANLNGSFSLGTFQRSASAVNNGGGINFALLDSGSNFQEYGYMGAYIAGNTAGAANGGLSFRTTFNGTTRMERMRIYPSGSVDIGMDINESDGGLLNLASETDLFTTDIGEPENYLLNLRHSFSTNGAGNGIAFSAVNSGGFDVGAAIIFKRTGGESQGELQFYTKQSTSAGADPVQAMVINNAGNVGIGTTSPTTGKLVLSDSASALTVDAAQISATTGTTTNGVDGLQIDFANAGSSANTNSGLTVNVTSNNTNASAILYGLNIAALSSGGENASEIALNIGSGWDQGLVIATGNNDGTGMVYSGGGRPTKTITLSPEYAGAVLTASYGGGNTDSSITGSLTSDTDSSANLLRNYYQWTSTQGSLNYYTVAVRVKLPKDFSAWATSNAIQIDYVTQSTSTSNNVVNVYIYNGDDTPGTAVVTKTNNVSSVASTWATLAIDDSEIDEGGAPDWDAPDEAAVIYLRMGALSSNVVKIGDIRLNYLAKF